MIMASKSLLDPITHPTREEVVDGIVGTSAAAPCNKIIDAVLDASEKLG
jgi:hypothetical protein